MNMVSKPWSTKEVAMAHNYLEINETSHLNKFIEYCNDLLPSVHSDFMGIKILDLGCGNGRLAISLNKLLNNQYIYVGIDINEDALNAGRKINPKDGSTIKLLNFDVDKTPWNNDTILMHGDGNENLIKYDICLIDSTLHMFYKPLDVLNEVSKFCNIIYITRNKLELSSGIQMGLFKWGGMVEDSPYWKFSQELFDNWARFRNMNVIYEIGPTPETYNIILEKNN